MTGLVQLVQFLKEFDPHRGGKMIMEIILLLSLKLHGFTLRVLWHTLTAIGLQTQQTLYMYMYSFIVYMNVKQMFVVIFIWSGRMSFVFHINFKMFHIRFIHCF